MTRTKRTTELLKMLTDKRQDLVSDLNSKFVSPVLDDVEVELERITRANLSRCDEAIRRLHQGIYGLCKECGGEISEARLRAVMFAVRCKDCEDSKETAEHRARAAARESSMAVGLFKDM